MGMKLTEVGDIIRQDILAGRGTRVTIGSKGAVLGASDGLPPTLADYATKAECEGMTFDATTIAPTGTKAAKVAEAAAKPNAIAMTTAPVSLNKYAGLALLSLERQVSSVGIAAAIYSALAGQALLAYEADAYAALAAAAADVSPAPTSYLAGIAAAQGQLLSTGARPGVVVIPASVYPDVVAEVVSGTGFGADPRSPVGTILGSLVHISSATGTEVVVADPAALLAVQHTDSPMCVSDPYTQADTNQIRLVLDVIAAFVVANAAGTAGFTVAAAGE